MGIKVTGTVCRGNKIGRVLGYPTANIVAPGGLDICNGVYTAYVEVNGRRYNAMAYLGVKPTVSGENVRILEANIFDFDREIYDLDITVELLDFIRSEERFTSLDHLKAQLGRDKKAIMELFSGYC